MAKITIQIIGESVLYDTEQFVVLESPVGEFTVASTTPTATGFSSTVEFNVTKDPGIYKAYHFDQDPGDVTDPNFEIPQKIPLPAGVTHAIRPRCRLFEVSSRDIASNAIYAANFGYSCSTSTSVFIARRNISSSIRGRHIRSADVFILLMLSIGRKSWIMPLSVR